MIGSRSRTFPLPEKTPSCLFNMLSPSLEATTLLGSPAVG